jgi:ribosomal protein S4
MGIADFFRPKHRHSDVRVRIEAVRAMTAEDAATLLQIARTDREAAVRRVAIEKIDKADVLAELAAAEADERVRELAGERAARLWLTAACGEDAEPAGAALNGIIKIGDQHALVEVAARGGNPAIRKRAFGELRDPKVKDLIIIQHAVDTLDRVQPEWMDVELGTRAVTIRDLPSRAQIDTAIQEQLVVELYSK